MYCGVCTAVLTNKQSSWLNVSGSKTRPGPLFNVVADSDGMPTLIATQPSFDFLLSLSWCRLSPSFLPSLSLSFRHTPVPVDKDLSLLFFYAFRLHGNFHRAPVLPI